MFRLFRKKDKSSETGRTGEAANAENHDYPTAPGTEIRYSPELISDLKGEHQALLDLYTEIKTGFDNAQYETVSELLDRFRGVLQGHLLTENIRLYIYLERQFAHDDTNVELIRDFRREMDQIGRTAMNFLRKYEAIGVDRDLATAFDRDFSELGEVLTQRIEREEKTLYPLYMPTY